MSLEDMPSFAFLTRARTTPRHGQEVARLCGSPVRIASHVDVQKLFDGSQWIQRSGPPCSGQIAGSAQHVPVTSKGHITDVPMSGGKSRAQNEPKGHPSEPGPPEEPGPSLCPPIPQSNAVSEHSPGLASDVPTVRRRQSFQYVMPSQPQTGIGPSSHTTGRASHVPPRSPQPLREQNVVAEQSLLSTQRFA
jgi:hypothetical protein